MLPLAQPRCSIMREMTLTPLCAAPLLESSVHAWIDAPPASIQTESPAYEYL